MGDDTLLRVALRIDATASAVLGSAGALAAPALAGPLGVPTGWLVGLGAGLVVWAAGLTWLAARPRVPAGGVWAVLAVNVCWVLDSVAMLAGGWWPLTGLGTIVVVGQAVAVLAVADLEYLGLRRSRSDGRVAPVAAEPLAAPWRSAD
jgi:hypothetical protein